MKKIDYAKETFNTVRRDDREVKDESWIREMLQRAPYGSLATCWEGQPFLHTSLFAYDEKAQVIYIHSAREGRRHFNIEASFLGITLSVYLARRYLDRRSLASLGLKWNSQAAIDLLFGFFLTGILMGMVYLGESALGWLQFKDFSWQVQSLSFFIGGILISLLAFIFTGFQEELFSRGYQLQNLAEGLNLTWGVLISSFIFALLHLGNPNISATAVIGLVAAGFFLAYAYLRTRQLWLPIGLHVGWNFFESTVFGFPVSGIQNLPVLIRQAVHGPDLVTGGAFGPEAGLIILPVLVLGAAAIYLYSQRRVKG